MIFKHYLHIQFTHQPSKKSFHNMRDTKVGEEPTVT
jgi:hypothetical protein